MSFNQFFDNVHCYLDTINLQNYTWFEPILDYIERSNNHLKFLGMGLKKSRNEEELNLLRRIKDKGVEIAEFNSIYRVTDYI
ncbi:hypothetical protein C1645_762481 [Glomus cerebriforme]|uniref:Uncharacterized protein n=1 Tax=Glomus cerebriforme TaxID=658196 RepID=A0A397T7Z5_9GLOM|nr:hypothetical protein C1645_762481 [Glomus cerebriforme]